MAKLIDILPEELKPLTAAEELVLEKAPKGEFADLQIGNEEKDDPANAERWGEERTIRAALIRWLCTNGDSARGIHAKGLRIKGARVDGRLDFENATIPWDLVFYFCAFPDVIALVGANTHSLHFGGSHLSGILGDQLRADGQLFLHEINSTSGLNFVNAHITGQLSAWNARITNRERNGGGYAFIAQGIVTGGSVLLSMAEFNGEVNLRNATIKGLLRAEMAKFNGMESHAIDAERLVVNDHVFFNKIEAKGEIHLVDANIEGALIADEAKIDNPSANAINANRISIKGGLFLSKIRITGELRICDASINGDLHLNEASLGSSKQIALNADGIAIKGNFYMHKTRVSGEIRMSMATIERALHFDKSEIKNENGYALKGRNLYVRETLYLHDLGGMKGVVDLRGAKVRHLFDDKTSWPEQGGLYIDTFEYETFSGESVPLTTEDRLRWIHLQSEKPFHPQPYDQLARVFRRMGYEDRADDILIAKYDDLIKLGDLRKSTKALYAIWGFMISYGYRIHRVLWGSLIMVVLGWAIFWTADSQHIMQPSKERVYMDEAFKDSSVIPNEYPKFESLIYSLDVLVPLIDLHQENYWLPDITKPGTKLFLGWSYGWLYRAYMWIHIVVGWILTSLLVAYFAGFVRRQRE